MEIKLETIPIKVVDNLIQKGYITNEDKKEVIDYLNKNLSKSNLEEILVNQIENEIIDMMED